MQINVQSAEVGDLELEGCYGEDDFEEAFEFSVILHCFRLGAAILSTSSKAYARYHFVSIITHE